MSFYRIAFWVVAAVWWVVSIIGRISTGHWGNHDTEMFAIFLVGAVLLGAVERRGQ